jgi:hypothetical protein
LFTTKARRTRRKPKEEIDRIDRIDRIVSYPFREFTATDSCRCEEDIRRGDPVRHAGQGAFSRTHILTILLILSIQPVETFVFFVPSW